jgi:hypothetical protein
MGRIKSWVSRNPWWSLNLALAVILAGLALLGHFTVDVGYFARDKETAATLINEFHKKRNEGRFNDIYENSSHVSSAHTDPQKLRADSTKAKRNLDLLKMS